MGILDEDDEAIEAGRPASGEMCGVEEDALCRVGGFPVDFRLEPKPRLLKREFEELIWARRDEGKERRGARNGRFARPLRIHLSAIR